MAETKSNRLSHGMCLSKEYVAWRAAKSRCLNKNNPGFSSYGGRGITMSQEWQASFVAFFKDMGQCPPGRSLDRINNDGNYEKNNCRWALPYEQYSNTQKAKRITHNGETHTLREWSRRTGIPYSTLNKRYRRGYPLFSGRIVKRKPYRRRSAA